MLARKVSPQTWPEGNLQIVDDTRLVNGDPWQNISTAPKTHVGDLFGFVSTAVDSIEHFSVLKLELSANSYPRYLKYLTVSGP